MGLGDSGGLEAGVVDLGAVTVVVGGKVTGALVAGVSKGLGRIGAVSMVDLAGACVVVVGIIGWVVIETALDGSATSVPGLWDSCLGVELARLFSSSIKIV